VTFDRAEARSIPEAESCIFIIRLSQLQKAGSIRVVKGCIVDDRLSSTAGIDPWV
jgi:hypothetical protein